MPMPAYGRNEKKSFHAEAEWWGNHGHQNAVLSLGRLVKNREDAQVLFEVLCGSFSSWSWEAFNPAYSERAYAIILNWDSWTLKDGDLCRDLLEELRQIAWELWEQHPGTYTLIKIYLLLGILIQGVNDHCLEISQVA